MFDSSLFFYSKYYVTHIAKKKKKIEVKSDQSDAIS